MRKLNGRNLIAVLLGAAALAASAHASRIKVPTTWLVGGDDPIADPHRSKAIAATVSGANYHDLVGLKHEVFNEVSRDTVFAEVTRVLATI